MGVSVVRHSMSSEKWMGDIAIWQAESIRFASVASRSSCSRDFRLAYL